MWTTILGDTLGTLVEKLIGWFFGKRQAEAAQKKADAQAQGQADESKQLEKAEDGRTVMRQVSDDSVAVVRADTGAGSLQAAAAEENAAIERANHQL
jgi:hypothetical protein